MEAENDETFDSRSAWEKLRDMLEDELDEYTIQEAITLMKDKMFHSMSFVLDISHPRQFMEILEKSYTQKECFEILRHVFSITKFNIDSGRINIAEIMEEYEKQLARDPMDFIGRGQQIRDVMKCFEETKYKGIWLCGLGGMGKTRLAQEICLRLQHNLKYKFIEVDMKGKDSLIDLSQEILLAQNLLCGESREMPNKREYLERPTQASILKRQVLQSLHNFSNKSVLLLDNMDDLREEEQKSLASYLRDLLSGISELGDQCKLKVIITARHMFHNDILGTGQNMSGGYEGFHWRDIELDKLSQEDGQMLAMKAALPRRLAVEESSQVVEACGGCPLAICIMSRYIRRQWKYPVTEILSSIRWRLSDIVPCCIEKAFDDLPQETKEQFIQLSVFNICPFNVQSAAAIWFNNTSKASIARAEMGLLQLKYKHMLERGRPCNPDTRGLLTTEDDTVTYSLHPLVFNFLSYLLGNNKHLEDSSNLAKARFLELYLNKLSMVEESLERGRKHAIQIAAADKVHLRNIFLWNSSLTQSTYNTFKFIHLLGIKTSNRLAMFAKSIHKAKNTMGVFQRLTETSKEMGNTDAFLFWSVKQAEACLDINMVEEAETIMRNLHGYVQCYGKEDEYRLVSIGEFHYVQGMLFNKNKQYRQALREFETFLELYKTYKLEETFPFNHAAAINAKGNVYFKLEEYGNALTCHKTAHDLIVKRVGGDFHEHKTIYLHNIGSINHVLALVDRKTNKEKANGLLEEALKTYNKCIDTDLHYKQTADPCHAERLRIRSDVYLRMKRFFEAFQDAEKALQIQKDVYVEIHPSITISRYQLARCYMKRAKIYRNEGRKEEADSDQKKCWLIFVKIQDEIERGGLSRKDPHYVHIRDDHLKLIKYGTRQEPWKIKNFYALFVDNRLGRSKSSSSESESSDGIASASEEDPDDRVYLGQQEGGISDFSSTSSSLEGLLGIFSFLSLKKKDHSTEEGVFMGVDNMRHGTKSPAEDMHPEALAAQERSRKRKLPESDD